MGKGKMLTKSSILFFSFLSFFCFLSTAVVPAGSAELIDRVVAVVNGEIVTQRQLEQEVFLIRRELGLQDEERLRDVVLERVINERILVQEAKKEGITVNSQELEEVFSGIKGHLSDETFEKMLREENLSLKEFRERLKRRILREKLIAYKLKEMDKKVKVDEEEIRNFYLKFKRYLKEEKAQEEVQRFYRRYQQELARTDKDEGKISLERIKDKIEDFLRQREKEKLLQNWLEELRSHADIEVKTIQGEDGG